MGYCKAYHMDVTLWLILILMSKSYVVVKNQWQRPTNTRMKVFASVFQAAFSVAQSVQAKDRARQRFGRKCRIPN